MKLLNTTSYVFSNNIPTPFHEIEIKIVRVQALVPVPFCYNGTLDMLEAPIITAHFRGADVQLNALNTFYQVDHEVLCFAFLKNGNSSLVIYGNVAQQNFLVGFDIKNNVTTFKPTDCTKY
ncbi:unnamed protein product [Lathyrus sativus]|nr:unnamed protein product [Lathyrus sativus]